MDVLKPILREPMVMFLLVGGLIYFLYAGTGTHINQIRLDESQVEEILSERELVIGRELSQDESDDAIKRYIDREILVREAIAKGLYLKDSVIYKRLAEQMYFLIDDEPPEPTVAQLQAQFESNPKAYLSPTAYTFEHVYFKSSKAKAKRALADIQQGQEPDELGDVFWLGQRLEQYSVNQLVVLMGFKFHNKLEKLPFKEWQGPIQSGRGWHLVKLIEKHEPTLLPETELQQKLIDDWKSSWRESKREQQLAEIRENYDIFYTDKNEG